MIGRRPLILGGRELALGGHTWVMAVINLSPESHNLHTVAHSPNQALAMAETFAEAGARIIDLGGQSSHYANPTISEAEEVDRLAPAVELLAANGHLVSVDTWKPAVARAALAAGAHLVNDTGGLTDPEMRAVIAEWKVPTVLVYVEGENPHGVGEVDTEPDKARRTAALIEPRLTQLEAEGIHDVIIDPGIALNYRGDYLAYTKTQLEVIRASRFLHSLGRPVLIPIPRKKEDHRVMAYITMALEYGADLIRVHDVAPACDLVELFGRTPPAWGR
ncbi:MAG: dihydropteroate synthase [Acidimicrobiia bacterium]